MTVQSFTFNPFQTNCFVCHDGDQAVIVDPSCDSPSSVDRLLGYVREHGLHVERILLTHAHIDHIFGCAAIAREFGIGLWMHRSEKELLGAGEQQAAMFGVALEPPPEPAGYLTHGDRVTVGGAAWDVLHTPGHSPGSISFVDRENGFVLSGDVLFHDSIGRTDLWQGSLPVLMRSIFEQLVPLGDDVVVHPGHGPSTTIGRERLQNPFLVNG